MAEQTPAVLGCMLTLHDFSSEEITEKTPLPGVVVQGHVLDPYGPRYHAFGACVMDKP